MAKATLRRDSPYQREAEAVVALTHSAGVILIVLNGDRGTGLTALIDDDIPVDKQLTLQLEVITAVRDAIVEEMRTRAKGD
jgi:hypothetical protein